MEPTVEDLQNTYRRYTDDQLIRIATTNAVGLRSEAIQVLQNEIRNRGLSESLLKGIDRQRKEISEVELAEYCEILQNLPCPICGSTTDKLNATVVGSVVSIIVFTNYDKILLIACKECRERANKKAMIKTSLLGWWGIPWGIFKTIQALMFNSKMLSQALMLEPNDYFKSFVVENIGVIETNKANVDELKSLIKHLN